MKGVYVGGCSPSRWLSALLPLRLCKAKFSYIYKMFCFPVAVTGFLFDMIGKKSKFLTKLLLACSFCITYSGLAQQNRVLPEPVRMVRAMDLLSRPLSSMPNIGLAHLPAEVRGDVYLTPYWNNASIILYADQMVLDGLAVKFDIYRNEFDIRFANGVRVLPGSKVKTVVWADSLTRQLRYFINASDFKENGVPLKGFFEVLSDGAIPLLSLSFVEILEPDFNPALNVGSRDIRIIQKNNVSYLLGNEVFRIKSKKQLEELFQSHQKEMKDFMKKNQTNVNSVASLRMVFDYYNYYVNRKSD